MCIGIRYTVSTCSYSSSRHGHPKLREKCFLFIHWHALHLVELQQDHHTFASSLSFSRIDRIYTNLHPAIHMFHELLRLLVSPIIILFFLVLEPLENIHRYNVFLLGWCVTLVLRRIFKKCGNGTAIVINMSVARVTHLTGLWSSNHVPAKPGRSPEDNSKACRLDA